jgi:hypothetical protein
MFASRIIFTVFVGLATFGAFGQTPPTPATTDPTQGQAAGGQNPGGQEPKGANQGLRNNQRTSATQAGTPNGDATDATQTTEAKKPGPMDGPEIVDDPNATPEQRASAEYSGPAVLSRGISASEPLNPKNVKFTPSVGVEYIYNSGLTGTTVKNGRLLDANSSGVQLSYGITGEKVFKRDTFSLGFHGSLYHYMQQSNFDGTDNELSMTWTHRLSRHLSFGVRESLTEFNRNNLLLSGSQLVNTGAGTTLVTTTPATEAFDGRVINVFNEGNVTWQINARLSLNLSGGGFFTRRASTSLYGDTGYQAGADVAYRITRHVTVGAFYGYTHFDYTGIYGGSDIQTVGLAYSIAFNPSTELITRIGGARLETTGLQTIGLDPFTAAIFGVYGTVEAVYVKTNVPDVNVQIRHKVSNLNTSISYARGITPGNGVILTSTRQSVIGGVDFRLGRDWQFTGTGGYDSLNGVGIATGNYGSIVAGGGVSRTLHRGLNWHGRFDYHHYTFDQTGFLRNSFVFSTGLIWTPGNMLEHLW